MKSLDFDEMNPEIRERLSNLLKEMQAGRPQRQFAKDLGVSHVTVRSWIEGEGFPSQENLEMLANKLDMGLEEFLALLRSDSPIELEQKKAEDFYPLTNQLSSAEAFKLAKYLMERVSPDIFD